MDEDDPLQQLSTAFTWPDVSLIGRYRAVKLRDAMNRFVQREYNKWEVFAQPYLEMKCMSFNRWMENLNDYNMPVDELGVVIFSQMINVPVVILTKKKTLHSALGLKTADTTKGLCLVLLNNPNATDFKYFRRIVRPHPDAPATSESESSQVVVK